MSRFAIAGVQADFPVADNVDAMAREVAIVMARFPWVNMIVFGELAALGPRPEAAQPMPGPAEEHFRALARKHNVWLVPGSIYEMNGNRIYNTAPVIDPTGEVVARYRKMYPFQPYETGIEPGGEFVVFDVPEVGRFGVSICYDMWFPETTRTMAWMGAEVIIHPTLTNTIDRDVELSIARASAATNQCYFVDINSSGRLAYGRSIVVGPEGDVIHQAGTGYEIIPFEADLERVRRSRRNGLHGLGQPLKSFRDNPVEFPPYANGRTSPVLKELGPLEIPPRHNGNG